MATKKASPRKSPAKKAPAKKAVKKNAPSLTSQDAKWQAEDDVRTLIRADEIKTDKSRLTQAKKMAKIQATEASKIASKLGK